MICSSWSGSPFYFLWNKFRCMFWQNKRYMIIYYRLTKTVNAMLQWFLNSGARTTATTALESFQRRRSSKHQDEVQHHDIKAIPQDMCFDNRNHCQPQCKTVLAPSRLYGCRTGFAWTPKTVAGVTLNSGLSDSPVFKFGELLGQVHQVTPHVAFKPRDKRNTKADANVPWFLWI